VELFRNAAIERLLDQRDDIAIVQTQYGEHSEGHLFTTRWNVDVNIGMLERI
jgi:hypothetical protein